MEDVNNMSDKDKRNFYRQCKEDLEFYLSTVKKEDYYFIFKPVGPPSDKPFVELKEEMAEDLMKYLWLYFVNKMETL